MFTNKYGHQGQFLFLIGFSSETAWQNGAKLGRKHLCKILYKASSFGSIRPTNMAAKINSFWFHLAKLFQRRRLKYEKVNRRTTDAK
jgi:hypothetical protein